jgi:hypothetical protein
VPRVQKNVPPREPNSPSCQPASMCSSIAAMNARTVACAVNPTVIATLADAHLRTAALTVVEPVGRLVKRPQCYLPKHWTAPEKAGIKALQIRLPRRCAPRARGSRPIKSRAFVYLTIGLQHSEGSQTSLS